VRIPARNQVKRWRHYTVVILFAGTCVALSARVIYLGSTERDFLQEQGDARSVRVEKIPSHRGVVYDRHGEPLAVSTPVVAVWTDPRRDALSDSQLGQVANAVGANAGELRAVLDAKHDRSFAYLKRQVSWAESERLRALDIEGVHFINEYRRYYPGAETVAHVVGVTDVDDIGLEGIELAYDHVLKGSAGEKVVLRDRKGNNIRDLDYRSAPRFGSDIALSIDLRLQYLAYRELKAAIEGHEASSGSIVMLDVNTGEILALANQPSYNPNDVLDSARMRNRAVTDSYEPGSTVKPFTVLAALESGRFASDTLIDTGPGYFNVGPKLIQDPVNRGIISLAEALKKSSQVGFARIALNLEKQAVFGVFARAGFGDFVGAGLPGETPGTLRDEGLSRPLERVTLAYGYGLSVTPLQLARAYLTIATGGIRLPVSIVRQNRVPDGERMFDAHLVIEVREMLEGVTAPDGTAPGARVDGYRVGGKTGTARKVGAGGYSDERHVALFAGIAPIDDPRVVMVVIINEPQRSLISGGAVAAPVFSRVAGRALRLLGVPPSWSEAV